nr:zinc finger, CCHC-type [Tanacetum cinerariifolium]GEW07112.1 zinc finger, CCHC-type [Tanacetum cinerariifolium]
MKRTLALVDVDGKISMLDLEIDIVQLGIGNQAELKLLLRAVVRLPDTKLKTLGERGIECIFVGYAEHSKAFRFYVIKPNESVLINSIIESYDAIFDKNIFSSVPRPSLRIPNGNEDIGGSVILEDVNAKVLHEGYGEADVILVSTPIDTGEKLRPNNGQDVSQLEYSRVVGCLMYAMTCTRLDLAFTVGKVSRYTSNHSTQHWQAIQRALKYLKKTIDYSLTYIGTDVSWISNTEDNSSTTGWVFLLGGGTISWASKKQTCITSSIIEYEFVALATAPKEAKWLRNLIIKIPL